MSTLPLTTTPIDRSRNVTDDASAHDRSVAATAPPAARSAAMPALVVGLAVSLLLYVALTAYVVNGLAHRLL